MVSPLDRCSPLLLALLLAGSLLPSTALAEDDTDCDEEAPVLEDGVAARGRLDEDDPRLDSDDTAFDLWAFEGDEGEWVTLTMESSAFNPYIYTVRSCSDDAPEETTGASELSQDSAVAVVSFALPYDGRYLVRANSIDRGEENDGFGAYTLTLTREASPLLESMEDFEGNGAPAPDLDAPLNDNELEACEDDDLPVLERNDVMRGTLSDRDPVVDPDADPTPVHYWEFEAEEGERLYLRMDADDYNPFIYGIFNCDEERMQVHDSADSLEYSEIVFDVPADDRYILIANALSWDDDVDGDYTIEFAEEVPEEALARFEGRSTGMDGEGEEMSSLVRCEGTASWLDLGDPTDGTLDEDDLVFEVDSTYYDLWRFEGERDQWITLTIDSDDFNPYLLGLFHCEGDDTGTELDTWTLGDDPESYVTSVQLPDDGEYLLRVNAYTDDEGEGGTGDYTLTVSEGKDDRYDEVMESMEHEGEGEVDEMAPLNEDEMEDCADGDFPELSHDRASSGSLTARDRTVSEVDLTPVDLWIFEGAEGDVITLRMMSDELEPYILGVYPCSSGEMLDVQDTNDDPEIFECELTLDDDGTYVVKANALTFEPEEAYGSYTLRLVVLEPGD